VGPEGRQAGSNWRNYVNIKPKKARKGTEDNQEAEQDEEERKVGEKEVERTGHRWQQRREKQT
jgi:hypothetical protein